MIKSRFCYSKSGFLSVFYLSPKESNDTYNEEENDYYGEDEGDKGTHPFCDLESFSLVCLFGKVFPSPSVSAYAEDYEDQGSERKHYVTYYKVLEVHDYRAISKGCDE